MFLVVHIQHLGKHIRIHRSICIIGTMMQPFSYGITQNFVENHNLLVSHIFEERVPRASPTNVDEIRWHRLLIQTLEIQKNSTSDMRLCNPI